MHISHLEDFKEFLREVEQIPYRDGKGNFQVLQVLTESGWGVIFKKASMPEHYSINSNLSPLIERFYLYRKSSK